MMRETPQQLAIAKALEELVAKAIRDFEFGLNVLKLPPSVKQPLWDALGRRAIGKAAECDGAPR